MQIKTKKTKIANAEDIAKIVTSILNAEDENDQLKEHFWAIGLRASNVIEYLELVSLGTLDAAIVHPRETFRLAILKSVNKIIIAHNHPSEDLAPSEKDLQITSQLVKAGEILGIAVLDHIIISLKGENYSFNNHGLIKKGKI